MRESDFNDLNRLRELAGMDPMNEAPTPTGAAPQARPGAMPPSQSHIPPTVKNPTAPGQSRLRQRLGKTTPTPSAPAPSTPSGPAGGPIPSAPRSRPAPKDGGIPVGTTQGGPSLLRQRKLGVGAGPQTRGGPRGSSGPAGGPIPSGPSTRGGRRGGQTPSAPLSTGPSTRGGRRGGRLGGLQAVPMPKAPQRPTGQARPTPRPPQPGGPYVNV